MFALLAFGLRRAIWAVPPFGVSLVASSSRRSSPTRPRQRKQAMTTPSPRRRRVWRQSTSGARDFSTSRASSTCPPRCLFDGRGVHRALRRRGQGRAFCSERLARIGAPYFHTYRTSTIFRRPRGRSPPCGRAADGGGERSTRRGRSREPLLEASGSDCLVDFTEPAVHRSVQLRRAQRVCRARDPDRRHVRPPRAPW